MTTISITSDAAPSVTVDLWGAEFQAVPITRSRQRAITALQGEFEQLDENAEDADDKAVELLARTLDEQLAPAQGKRKKASAWVLEKWHADELTVTQLIGLQEQLAEVARPT